MSHTTQKPCQEFFSGTLWERAVITAILMLSGTCCTAAPWVDRAIVRRSIRSERLEQRDRSRQENNQEPGNSTSGIPMIVPNNVLRPSVIRRLVRRGVTLEEIEGLTRGPQQIPGPKRQNSTEVPRQLEGRTQAAMPIVTEMKTAQHRSDGQSTQNEIMTADSVPKEGIAGQRVTDSKSSNTKSILVGGEEAIASNSDRERADTGPAFPGMEKQQEPTRETPVLTHEPIELLPTPKPKK